MKTIHLQGIGQKEAVKASELKVNDVTIWNYGYKEIILSISKSKSGKTLIFEIQSESGKILTRKIRINSLVAVEV